MFTLLDSISHNYSYAKLYLTFYYFYGILELIKRILSKGLINEKLHNQQRNFS